MAVDVAWHISRWESLVVDRTMFSTQWHEAAKLIDPAAKMFFFPHSTPPVGMKNTEEQFDATTMLAMQRFAAVIESLSTPQGNTWHRLVPVDKRLKKDKRTRQYLDDITDLLFAYRYRPNAGFVGQSQQCYHSLGGYGNMTLFVDKNTDSPGLRYKNIHLGDTYYVENHQGVVDGLYRVLKIPPLVASQLFGANCPASVRTRAMQPNGSSWTNRNEFLHVVSRRQDYDPRRLDEKGMPFESCYIYPQEKLVIREGGYRSFPYVIGRYTQTSGETYGRGPAQWVLPSIKLLNEEKKTFIRQGHRAVDPVLLAFDDGVMSSVSLRPGAVNWGGVTQDGKPLVSVLPSGNLELNEKMMEMERNLINDAFLISLFQILTENPQMTATEVLERTREKGILIAPTAGRMQAEFLGPMIDREMDVLQQQGLLPPPPPQLAAAGGHYEIEYDSPMSRMQRADKAAGFFRAMNRAAEYMKMTNDPSPLDFFNFDAAMPDLMDIDGAPASWTNTMEVVAQKRAERAKQQQQQQMIDAAPALASVAKGAQGQPKGGTGNPSGMPNT